MPMPTDNGFSIQDTGYVQKRSLKSKVTCLIYRWMAEVQSFPLSVSPFNKVYL